MASKRYYVAPCDNLGSLTPPPPRDRTWIVMDRVTGQSQSEYDRRIDARTEAARLNAINDLPPEPFVLTMDEESEQP